jgi:hypothetical protein
MMSIVIPRALPLVLYHILMGTAIGQMVVNGSFETPEGTIGRPTTFGDWGDNYTAIVTAENGIAPFDGMRMLKFIGGGNTGGGPSTTVSTLRQAIDLGVLSALVSSGRARFEVSGYFNRVPGDAQTDSQFSLRIHAYSGNVANFPVVAEDPLAETIRNLTSDANLSSWQLVQASLVLPTNTSYVAVSINAHENIFNEPGDLPEFDGHYADLVSLSISPPPGDFNRDNTIDAADYPLWRRSIGELVPACSGPDANCNGAVDNNDYQIWRSNFGRSLGSGASQFIEQIDIQSPAVPESTALTLAILGISVLLACRRLKAAR